MLEPGDFRFEHESGAAVRVVGVLRLDLFEGHLAMELLVFGDKDFSEAPLGMFAIMRKRADDVVVPTDRGGIAGCTLSFLRLGGRRR